MVYDALAESVALIETRALHPILRLSRRRRFVPMAMDVAGDIAATMFLRRGAGCVHEEVWHCRCETGNGACSEAAVVRVTTRLGWRIGPRLSPRRCTALGTRCRASTHRSSQAVVAPVEFTTAAVAMDCSPGAGAGSVTRPCSPAHRCARSVPQTAISRCPGTGEPS